MQKLSRGQVVVRLARVPPCLVGMEACVGAHHLSRQLLALGHEVKLVSGQFVQRLGDFVRPRCRCPILFHLKQNLGEPPHWDVSLALPTVLAPMPVGVWTMQQSTPATTLWAAAVYGVSDLSPIADMLSVNMLSSIRLFLNMPWFPESRPTNDDIGRGDVRVATTRKGRSQGDANSRPSPKSEDSVPLSF
jgi:hypothetical protein